MLNILGRETVILGDFANGHTPRLTFRRKDRRRTTAETVLYRPKIRRSAACPELVEWVHGLPSDGGKVNFVGEF